MVSDYGRSATGMCVVTNDFCPGRGLVMVRVVRGANTRLRCVNGDRLRGLDFAVDVPCLTILGEA